MYKIGSIMNFILALVLAIIILLCMFLIKNKIVATAVVIVVVSMMILGRPRDFTMGNAYLMKHTAKSNENNSSASMSNNNTNNNNNANKNIPYASNDVYVESGDSNGLMNSYAMYQNNISNMLGLSEENKDKISETLEEINWGNIFKRATSQLKSYGNEYENNGNNGNPSAANSASNNFATNETGSVSAANSASNNFATSETGSVSAANSASNNFATNETGSVSAANSASNNFADTCDDSAACNMGSNADCVFPETDRVDCDGNPLYCEILDSCNYNKLLSEGPCEPRPENYTCNGSWIGPYCGSASACNTGSRANCTYPETDRVDCDGNPLYCEILDSCNYNKLLSEGPCEPRPENYTCNGSWIGPYCGSASACNTGSNAECEYPETDRVDCDGNNLYCEDSQACNYNKLLSEGPCEPRPENYTCNGSWIGPYCDPDKNPTACNPGSKAYCIYASDLYNNDRDCYGICVDENAKNYEIVGSCEYDEVYNIFGDSIKRNSDDGSYTLIKDVTLTQDIEFTETFTLYLATGVTFDGGYNSEDSDPIKITYTGTDDWTGLFQPAKNITVTIKNVNFMFGTNSTASIAEGYGGIMGEGVKGIYEGSVVTIDNCHVDADLSKENSGGIAGQFFGAGSDDNICTITNCSFKGEKISGQDAGGICGTYAGRGGTVRISNCYTDGKELEISGRDAGGICGQYAGYSNGTVTIYNCYTTGTISGTNAGGICGQYAGDNGGTATIYNCYTTGTISGTAAGGICGRYAGYGGTLTIYNCYTTGDISGEDAGGICGHKAGVSGTVNIYNCYTTGEIVGENSGGICGLDAGDSNGTVTVVNCVSQTVNDNITSGKSDGSSPMDGNTPQDTSDWDDCNAKDTIGTIVDNMGDYELKWHIPSLTSESDPSPWFICGEDDESNIILSGSGSCNFSNLDCTDVIIETFKNYKGTVTLANEVYTLENDVTFNSNIDLSLTDLNGYTFDGNNKTITYNGSNETDEDGNKTDALWTGLFHPATDVTVTIKNVNFTLGDSASIKEGCGGIIGEGTDDGYEGSVVTIDNCHVDADLSKENSGGIAGQFFGAGSDDNICTITNCSFKGEKIGGHYAGGICGTYAGRGGTVRISNCYTDGEEIEISGQDAGGICGQYAGYDGTAIIYNCYTTGEISGTAAGGICGEQAGYGGTVTIYNCYTTGDISGQDAGGICGQYAGVSGTVEIYNCYTTGDIGVKNVKSDAGGICGEYAGYKGTVNIYNCYTTGEIVGESSGGICGFDAGYGGTVTVVNCVSQTVNDNITSGKSDGSSPMDGNTPQDTSDWDDCNAKDTIGTIVDNMGDYELKWHIPSLTSESDPSPWFICGEDDESNIILSGSGSCNFSNLDCTDVIIETFKNYKGTVTLANEVYTLENDVTFTSNINLSLTDLNGSSFDGNNKTITYNGSDDWTGLFQPATGVIVTIQNINLTLGDSDSTSIAEGCGGIIGERDDGGYTGSEVTIDNCNVNADVSTTSAGGIVGQYAGYGGTLTISNCSTTGEEIEISGEDAGGICGIYAGYGGTLTIYNCYTEGKISGMYAGGICGTGAGYGGGTAIIYNCYTEGDILGKTAGGICGKSAGYNEGTVTIYNCYTTGAIGKLDDDTAMNSGGICGSYAGQNDGTITIYNCYTIGNVSGAYAGGICGPDAGRGGNLKIYNCYTTGKIEGTGTGGICGIRAGKNGDATITNCISRDGGNITSGSSNESSPMDGDSNNHGITQENDTWDDCHAKNTIGTIVDNMGDYDLRWHIPSLTGNEPYPWFICGEDDESNIILSGSGSCNLGNLDCTDVIIETFSNYGGTVTLANEVYTLKNDVTFTSNINLSLADLNGYTFDGNNKTITYTGSNETDALWTGLFQPATDITVTIQNVNFTLGDTASIKAKCGGIVGSGGVGDENEPYSYTGSVVTIDNCHVDADLSRMESGGIVGRYFGSGSDNCKISNCSTTGEEIEISGSAAGGICGYNAGKEGTVTIYNCYTEGKISGEDAGGICGHYAGNYGTVTIYNCYTTGDISGEKAGGICGKSAGRGGNVNIYNCYTSGDILGMNAGGICGHQAGRDNGTIKIHYCYTSGQIGESGLLSSPSGSYDIGDPVYLGGICGSYAGFTSGTVEIFNCYTTGEIGDRAGGICGESAGYNEGTVKIYNCYTIGNVGEESGGICGQFAGYNADGNVESAGTVIIYNCYTTGQISDKGSGGICGQYAGYDGDTVTVTNCISQAGGNLTTGKSDGSSPMDGTTTQEDNTWDDCHAKDTIGTIVDNMGDYELKWHIPSLTNESDPSPWSICGEDDESNLMILSGSGSCNFSNLDCTDVPDKLNLVVKKEGSKLSNSSGTYNIKNEIDTITYGSKSISNAIVMWKLEDSSLRFFVAPNDNYINDDNSYYWGIANSLDHVSYYTTNNKFITDIIGEELEYNNATGIDVTYTIKVTLVD